MERNRYAPGTPSWVDLGSPDLDASAAFYKALLGWEVDEAHPEAGGYRIATLQGRTVAGLGPQQGPVSAWTTYFATDDADVHAAAITANGGTVLMGPMDVMDQGRMVIATDPEGAAFGLWQSGAHTGAQVVDEPGAMGWTELWTRNVSQAKSFYPAVFGFVADDDAMAGYTIWKIGDQMVGGAMTIPTDMPPQVPAHWAVYFVVTSVDESVAQVTQLGGAVVAPPFDVEGVGRIAIVHGPAHESFGLFSS